MLSILLDTHILVWWHSDSARLAKAQARAILEMESRGDPVAISAITLWELAKMAGRGRVQTTGPLDLWIEDLNSHPSMTVLPLTARIAAESFQLGDDFHRDPADQIIVATARCHGLRLMTADERIRRWGKVPVI